MIHKYEQYNAGNVVNVLGLKITEACIKMAYNGCKYDQCYRKCNVIIIFREEFFIFNLEPYGVKANRIKL